MKHANCGNEIHITGQTGFCTACGKPVKLVDQSKGAGKRRRYYKTLTYRHYCPRCRAVTAWDFLQVCAVEKQKAQAWQCACNSILILPMDTEAVFGKVVLVGDKWRAKDLDPWEGPDKTWTPRVFDQPNLEIKERGRRSAGKNEACSACGGFWLNSFYPYFMKVLCLRCWQERLTYGNDARNDDKGRNTPVAPGAGLQDNTGRLAADMEGSADVPKRKRAAALRNPKK